jgi:hypothetical protein
MLTLVLWQHAVFLCVSRTVFRMDQADSKHRTTHTQKHDTLPYHQS